MKTDTLGYNGKGRHMSRTNALMRRLLAGTLAAFMVFTSVPDTMEALAVEDTVSAEEIIDVSDTAEDDYDILTDESVSETTVSDYSDSIEDIEEDTDPEADWGLISEDTEKPDEIESESGEDPALGGTITVTDSFGYTYTYDPVNWYKNQSRIDSENHTITFERLNGECIPENLYIPSTTMIDGVAYKTLLNMGGFYAPALQQGYGGHILKHVCIQEGVKTVGSGYSTFGMFDGDSKLESVDMTGVDMSSITTMYNCFKYCYALSQVKFGNNLNNVNSVYEMFWDCITLTEIDLSALDMSIDLSALDMSNVTTMERMFVGCTALTSVNLSNLDLSKVTTTKSMFNGCRSLTSVDLTGTDLPLVTTMDGMFYGCTSLKNFVFPDIDTSACTTICDMFNQCSSLELLDMSNFKADSLTNISYMYGPYDSALRILCLPHGMTGISNYFYLPKTMYHDGVEVPFRTYITSAHSGWILTSEENTRILNSPQVDPDGTVTWDCIWFGHYYQDESELYMDKDPIKWRVLSFNRTTGEALLLSDMNLDNKPYYQNKNYYGKPYAASDGWKESWIRGWLNSSEYNGFLRNAFSFEEQAAIIECDTDDNCKDKVFLLSFEDLNNTDYGFSDTNYVTDTPANGSYYGYDPRKAAIDSRYCQSGDSEDWEYGLYFLRDRHYIVENTGKIFRWNTPVYNDHYKVRPAIRLNLYDNSDLWSDAGYVTVDDNGESSCSEPEGHPASISYTENRWPFNNITLPEPDEEKDENDKYIDYSDYSAFKNRYYISQNDYEYFISALSSQERDRFKKKFCDYDSFVNANLDDWSEVKDHLVESFGSCYGMSLSEGLYLSGLFSPYGNPDLTLKDTAPLSDNPLIESLISLGQFLQITDLSENSKRTVEDYAELINKAGNIKSNNDYFLISYRWDYDENEDKYRSGHAVLCMGIENCQIQNGDDKYTCRLKIYDPNSSIYDDDYCYIYITDDRKVAYVPDRGLRFEPSDDTNTNLILYRDKSLLSLHKTREDSPSVLSKSGESSEQTAITPVVISDMKEMTMRDSEKNLWIKFINGIKDPESTLNGDCDVLCGNDIDSETGFRGGFYEIEDMDPAGTYSVQGGADDKLDVSFEYGDKNVDVYADETGVSAGLSDYGNAVYLDGLDSTGFLIENIYNENSPDRPGNSTKVCLSGTSTGKVNYTKVSNGVFELSNASGQALGDLLIYNGTTLRSEKLDEEFPDANGKLTLTFADDKIIVREDTDGDGTLDYEKSFSDFIPVTGITLTDCTIGVGQSKTLSAVIAPDNASEQKLFWSSEDTGVVTVVDGEITGVSAGRAVIKAFTGVGGASRPVGTCTVTVSANGADPDIPDDHPDGIWIKDLKASYTYTGSAIKPDFKVYRGAVKLKLKKDYTLKFTNNTKPGTATVTIKMKGNYSGSKKVTFKIDPATLGTDITAGTLYVAYKKNKTQKPKPVLYTAGRKVKLGKNDLSFTYPSVSEGTGKPYRDPGTYKIHIAAKNTNRFTGELDVDLVIAPKPLMSAVAVTVNRKSVPYSNGTPVSPVFTLKYKNKKLVEGTDYTVSYADDHTSIGNHKVTFIGNDTDYFGRKSYTFSITGKYDLTSDLADVQLDATKLDTDGSAPYTSGGAKPGAVVTYNGVRLSAGKDYTISYTGHKSLGTATATIKGKGRYKGSVPLQYTIKPRDIHTYDLSIADKPYSSKKYAYRSISLSFVDRNYTKKKLVYTRDYTITIDGNYGAVPAAGTQINVIIRGINNYTGVINTSFRIIGKNYDLSKATVTVNGGKAYDYTGDEIKPLPADLKVTLNKKPLDENCYEILGYYNNVKKSKNAYIILRGKGSYAGIKKVKFRIGAAPMERLWSNIIKALTNN